MTIKMDLTDKQRKIYHGLVCPYCNSPSELVSSVEVYGKDYGFVRLCRKCNAYVGCHRGTQIAKGRLANKELRRLKIQTHLYFDQLWKYKTMSRKEAYAWLAQKLLIPVEFTHIGWFNEKTCYDVIYYCKQFLNDMRRLDLDFGHEPQTDYYEK
jgi:hypothetical protein